VQARRPPSMPNAAGEGCRPLSGRQRGMHAFGIGNSTSHATVR
jgi:hypothetical protein